MWGGEGVGVRRREKIYERGKGRRNRTESKMVLGS